MIIPGIWLKLYAVFPKKSNKHYRSVANPVTAKSKPGLHLS